MRKFPLIALIAIISLSAGCFEPIPSVNIADPLNSLGNNVAQRQGFGELPATPEVQQSNAVIRLNTELPTLQPDVTVLRLPPNGLNETQFQNLTTSLDMPIGLIGKQAQNLEITFTWTNANNEVWSYDSNTQHLNYANAANSPEDKVTDSWPTDEQISKAVENFLADRGIDLLSYNNPSIQKNWLEWNRKITNKEACVNQNTINYFQNITSAKSLLNLPPPSTTLDSCLKTQYPSRIPVTFDIVIDERNIINENGQTEIGGFLILNGNTLQVEYGWLTLPASPARSDYPAITENEMRTNLLNGGLGGAPQGSVEINETFFAFIRLDSGDEYNYKYLVPALIGSGTQTFNNVKNPYNIVVPLTK